MAVRKRKIIEAEYGKPLPQILIELYKEHGSQTKVAQALGVNQSTVSDWLIRCGLVEVKRVQYVFTPTKKAKALQIPVQIEESA